MHDRKVSRGAYAVRLVCAMAAGVGREAMVRIVEGESVVYACVLLCFSIIFFCPTGPMRSTLCPIDVFEAVGSSFQYDEKAKGNTPNCRHGQQSFPP